MVPLVEVRDCEGDAFQTKQVSPGFTPNLTLRHRWQNATSHNLSEEHGAGSTSFNSTKFHSAAELPCKASWFLLRVGRVALHPDNPPLVCASLQNKPETPIRSAAGCLRVSYSTFSLSHEKLPLGTHTDIFCMCISQPVNFQAGQ